MSMHADCPACLSGNHDGHDPRWGVRPGLLGGSVCVCCGDCAERTKDRMKRLGASLDLPFEKQPLTPADLDHAHISGGLVVMAATIPVPDMGMKPALVYRFATPEGDFYPPMVLVVDEDQMAKLAQLTASATAAAIGAAS